MKKQFATSLDETLLKMTKIHAAEIDTNINQLIENALYLYLSINKYDDWSFIADNMPTGTFTGYAMQEFAYNKLREKQGK